MNEYICDDRNQLETVEAIRNMTDDEFQNYIAELFAKQQGCFGAKFDCKWNGYSCYSPVFDETDDSLKANMLEIIIDSNGNVRMASTEEFKEISDSCS